MGRCRLGQHESARQVLRCKAAIMMETALMWLLLLMMMVMMIPMLI